MKATKKICCVFAVFAMVMMTYSPAYGDYITPPLRGVNPFALNVTTVAGSAAVNIYWLRQGGIVDVELHTNPVGSFEIPRRATRVVFQVAGPKNSEGIFRLSQNGLSLAEESFGGALPSDKTIVFDIVW
ncbi:MAG TPA: hypothetical protein VJL58_06820 [Pyrinomonadaceae bacterium]|nr:hypothetical protein [Pyrinomonadaceae bacterium]